jgi:hypothetical protein
VEENEKYEIKNQKMKEIIFLPNKLLYCLNALRLLSVPGCESGELICLSDRFMGSAIFVFRADTSFLTE